MKKIISILMITILVLSLSTTTFATEDKENTGKNKREVEESIESILKEENIEEIEIELTENNMRLISKEEALKIGFSEQEIEERNIYEVQTEYNGSIPSVLYSGDVAYEDNTVTSSFTGAGHTIHADKVKYAFAIKSGEANLVIGFYSYNSNWHMQVYAILDMKMEILGQVIGEVFIKMIHTILNIGFLLLLLI